MSPRAAGYDGRVQARPPAVPPSPDELTMMVEQHRHGVVERQRSHLPLWLAVLFVGAAVLGSWFLLGPALRGGLYYRVGYNRNTYQYDRAILALFVPYGLALLAWRRGARAPLWVLLAGAAALHLLVLFAPPPQSQDFFQYLFYGRMQAAHGANPYVVHPSTFWADPWFPWIRWSDQTSVYGPVWLMVTAGVAKVAGRSLATGYVLLKLVILALDAAVVWLLVADARGKRPTLAANGHGNGHVDGTGHVRGDADPPSSLVARNGTAGWRVLVYAWNPLILITVPLAGAADVALAAAFVGAYVARRRGRHGVATVLLTLATLVKAYAVIALLLHLVLLLKERRARTAAGHAGLAAAISAVAYAPYWAGLATFAGLAEIARKSNQSLMGEVIRVLSPIPRLLGLHPGAFYAGVFVRVVSSAALLAVAVWAIRRVRDDRTLWFGVLAVLAAYIYLTPWFLYWYMVAPLALVAFLPENALTVPMLTFSGSTMFLFVFRPYPLALTFQTLARYVPPLVVLDRRRNRRGAVRSGGGTFRRALPQTTPRARRTAAAE